MTIKPRNRPHLVLNQPARSVPTHPVPADWISDEQFQKIITQARLLFSGVPNRVILHAMVAAGIVPLSYTTMAELRAKIEGKLWRHHDLTEDDAFKISVQAVFGDPDLRDHIRKGVAKAVDTYFRAIEARDDPA